MVAVEALCANIDETTPSEKLVYIGAKKGPSMSHSWDSWDSFSVSWDLFLSHLGLVVGQRGLVSGLWRLVMGQQRQVLGLAGDSPPQIV
jgi:hypothetical protein